MRHVLVSEKVAATHRLFTHVEARPVPGDSGHVDDRSEEGTSGAPGSGSGGGGDRGGAGTGRPLAAGLIDCGVSVVLADTATEPLQTTAEEFTARGARVLSVITDVSDAVAVDALASRTLEHFGRVDIVVNNAAITNDGGRPLWQTDPQDWQRVLGVNVLGVVHGIQAFVPYMVIAGAGHVVNIASLAGLTATPFAGAYCASKHAVVVISETLRGELDAIGLPIGVTVACPALVRTPMTEDLFTLTQADDDVLAQHLPAHLSPDQLRAQLKRMTSAPMEPEVAAECILAAVEADRLYALTHGDFEDGVRHRAEGILAALDDRSWSDIMSGATTHE